MTKNSSECRHIFTVRAKLLLIERYFLEAIPANPNFLFVARKAGDRKKSVENGFFEAGGEFH
jgi:hypothetical protein